MRSIKIHELLERQVIPAEEFNRVTGCYDCEYDWEFLGFTDIYKSLVAIIPKHYTIADMGCYCAAQAYYFIGHRQYIGVDVYEGERFKPANAVHYVKTIQRFIAEDAKNIDLKTCFAICSYIPDSDAVEKVRRTFDNLFVYYPAGITECIGSFYLEIN